MMERFTGKDKLGYYTPRDITLNCLKQRGKSVDRLGAYEDTGLTPEEVAHIASPEVVSSVRKVDWLLSQISAERLTELLKADKDGRLVVLTMANERRRLIDACKLDILGYLEEFPICDEDKGWNSAINSVFAHVACAPTVDAVEVVRCGDCKYWTQDGNGYMDDEFYCGNPDGIEGYPEQDDFCSYGEREI